MVNVFTRIRDLLAPGQNRVSLEYETVRTGLSNPENCWPIDGLNGGYLIEGWKDGGRGYCVGDLRISRVSANISAQEIHLNIRKGEGSMVDLLNNHQFPEVRTGFEDLFTELNRRIPGGSRMRFDPVEAITSPGSYKYRGDPRLGGVVTLGDPKGKKIEIYYETRFPERYKRLNLDSETSLQDYRISRENVCDSNARDYGMRGFGFVRIHTVTGHLGKNPFTLFIDRDASSARGPELTSLLTHYRSDSEMEWLDYQQVHMYGPNLSFTPNDGEDPRNGGKIELSPVSRKYQFDEEEKTGGQLMVISSSGKPFLRGRKENYSDSLGNKSLADKLFWGFVNSFR